MFKKLNTKTLIVLFVVLLLIVVVTMFVDNKTGERNFKSELFSIDSAKVTAINIEMRDKKAGTVKLSKSGDDWRVESNGKSFSADADAIGNLIKMVSGLKSARIAATEKSKWADFQLTDTACTKLKIMQNNETVANLAVGKFSFQQNQSNPYQKQGGTILTYVRIDGDDKVYEVDGYLSMMLGRGTDNFRNRSINKANKDFYQKLVFTYPSDSSFTVIKDKNRWTVNGQPADSVEMLSYLSTLGNLTGSEFADDMAVTPNAAYTLKIEGNMPKPIEIKAAVADSIKKYIITSSANPEAKFSNGNGDLFKRIFVNKGKLLKK